MNCARCHSRMSSDVYDDHLGASGQRIAALHGVICGDIVDPVSWRHLNKTVEPLGDRTRPAVVTST